MLYPKRKQYYTGGVVPREPVLAREEVTVLLNIYVQVNRRHVVQIRIHNYVRYARAIAHLIAHYKHN